VDRQLPAGLLVEHAKSFIGGRADEDQASLCYERLSKEKGGPHKMKGQAFRFSSQVFCRYVRVREMRFGSPKIALFVAFASAATAGWSNASDNDHVTSPFAHTIGRTSIEGGAAYSDLMSEGWADFLVPIHARENFAIGFHSRFSVAELDRSDIALGVVAGLWLERLQTQANLYAYWDRHEFIAGDFEEWAIGAALDTRIGRFQVFGHFAEEGVFVSGVRRSSSSTTQTEVFSQTRFENSAGFTSTFEDRRTVQTTTRLDEVFSDLLNSGDGFEAEYGFDLPWFDRFGALGVYAGYQWWDRAADPIEGITARVRWQMNDMFAIQGRYFEDERILGGVDNWRIEFVGSIQLGGDADLWSQLGVGGKKMVVTEPEPRRQLLRRPSRVTWPVLGRGERLDSQSSVSVDEDQRTILLSREQNPKPRIEKTPAPPSPANPPPMPPGEQEIPM
jgi:hypothetical protein